MNQPIGEILAAVADEILEGFQIVGRDGRYVYVNATVARQGKRAKEDLVGKTMVECYPGIEATPMFAALRRAMDERVSVRMENEFAYPDGKTRWFLLSMRPVHEGVMILSVDITERKRAEEEVIRRISELNAVLGRRRPRAADGRAQEVLAGAPGGRGARRRARLRRMNADGARAGAVFRTSGCRRPSGGAPGADGRGNGALPAGSLS
jgi:PAS domain S-box-containing protein